MKELGGEKKKAHHISTQITSSGTLGVHLYAPICTMQIKVNFNHVNIYFKKKIIGVLDLRIFSLRETIQ